MRRLKTGLLTNQNWPYKFQPGTVGFMIGILIHDIPVIFIVYFYYIKYLNVLASLQLPLMIFQAAHITLMFKYWNVQGCFYSNTDVYLPCMRVVGKCSLKNVNLERF